MPLGTDGWGTGNLDQVAVNTLRFLAVDMVEQARSGHPGMPLGAAPMAYVLWDRFLRHNPRNPQWFNRDRFILSAGHGSALLYFTAFFSSCFPGVKKPEDAIYRLALQVTQRAPEECLYIDDRALNLECAGQRGMRTLLYRNPAQLEHELRAAGIEF